MSETCIVTDRILAAFESNQWDTGHKLIREYGTVVATIPMLAPIHYYSIGDDVICVLSHTQVQFGGHMSQEPRWKCPKEADRNEQHSFFRR